MTVDKLSACKTLDELNGLIQGEVPIKVGAHLGRKFVVGGKSCTLNQIWQQYEKCLKHDRKAGDPEATLLGKMAAVEAKLQELDEMGNEQMEKLRKQGKSITMIKLRQALGNFFARLGGVNRKQIKERTDSLLHKFLGISPKDLKGKTPAEKDQMRKEKFEEKLRTSPDLILNGLSEAIASYDFMQIFAQPKPIVEAFFKLYGNDIVKGVQAKTPVMSRLDDFERNVKLIASLVEEAEVKKIDFSHSSSIPAEDFVRLSGEPKRITWHIKRIPDTDRGYIERLA